MKTVVVRGALQGIEIVAIIAVMANLLVVGALSFDWLTLVMSSALVMSLKDRRQRFLVLMFGVLGAVVERLILWHGVVMHIPLFPVVVALVALAGAIRLLRRGVPTSKPWRWSVGLGLEVTAFVCIGMDVLFEVMLFSGRAGMLYVIIPFTMRAISVASFCSLLVYMVEHRTNIVHQAFGVLGWLAGVSALGWLVGEVALMVPVLGPVLRHVPHAFSALPITTAAAMLVAGVVMRRRQTRQASK